MAKDYFLRYQEKTIKQVSLKLNRNTEKELIEWIEKKKNVQGYIKDLITEDMNKAASESR